ncbi:MAG: hypothetical protein JWQ35_307 [Bacteriovoracaceae bacterium]|nr:hypothetical protein [Bacteriovoracaceae bacterium]
MKTIYTLTFLILTLFSGPDSQASTSEVTAQWTCKPELVEYVMQPGGSCGANTCYEVLIYSEGVLVDREFFGVNKEAAQSRLNVLERTKKAAIDKNQEFQFTKFKIKHWYGDGSILTWKIKDKDDPAALRAKIAELQKKLEELEAGQTKK